MGGANGGPTPWKKAAVTPTNSTPESSRPGVKPPPPKPGVKPVAPAPKPNGGAAPARVGGGVGQMDLAAALAKRAQRMQHDDDD
ncbi:hypothetical protein NMY22_g20120 [Coprinellus aureogranulatus]|nr:hypothetical protein NMY22_g20120 [Coprinellus aureogranulatus]